MREHRAGPVSRAAVALASDFSVLGVSFWPPLRKLARARLAATLRSEFRRRTYSRSSDADALPSDSTSGVNLAANNCAVSLSVSVKIRYRTHPSVPGHGTSSDGGWLLREAALSVAVQPALRAT